MILHPLTEKRRRELVRPAFLDDEAHAIDERGRRYELSKLPDELRVFAQWERVDRFARDGIGELVAWGDEPIRWRHVRRGDSHRRRSDVVIVKVPTEPGAFAGGVVEWSDWLRRHDVSPSWSLGSSSMNLLRSTLDHELVTTNGELPEPRWTLGGRQQTWHEPGTTLRDLVQLDLQAAYTHVVGGLRYGGVWRRVEKPELRRLDLLAGFRLPILAHALVTLRDGLSLGPLPRRPRRRPEQGYDELAPNVPYPVAGRLVGLFSYAELAAARDAGCRVSIDVAYIHTGGRDVFAPWLDAILEGRELDGYAAALAKSTGNALWGQFVIDDRKLLSVLRWDAGTYSRLAVQGSKGHEIRAWDVGELVCGSVRAELFRTLSAFPRGDLVCAHTDGAWLRDTGLIDLVELAERGWRMKNAAAELRILDQQKYAYRVPRGRTWRYVISGVPASRSAETFERLWHRFEGREAA